jgi:hypothetical protein
VATSDPVVLVMAAAANTALLALARQHMAAFWNDREQVRIPFVDKFNDAVRGSERVVWILGVLSASWGVAGVGWGVMAKGWL